MSIRSQIFDRRDVDPGYPTSVGPTSAEPDWSKDDVPFLVLKKGGPTLTYDGCDIAEGPVFEEVPIIKTDEYIALDARDAVLENLHFETCDTGMKTENPMNIKPSDSNREFNTGAVRGEDGGRGKPSLLPWDAMIEISKVFEAGAKKYAARNWEKGLPLSSFVDSMGRHEQKFLRGDTDEPHAAQIAWNAICLLQTYMWIKEGKLPQSLNDLPNVITKTHSKG